MLMRPGWERNLKEKSKPDRAEDSKWGKTKAMEERLSI